MHTAATHARPWPKGGGGLRADASIRVVADVRLDSDLDGLSDFNEALLGTQPVSPPDSSSSAVCLKPLAIR